MPNLGIFALLFLCGTGQVRGDETKNSYRDLISGLDPSREGKTPPVEFGKRSDIVAFADDKAAAASATQGLKTFLDQKGFDAAYRELFGPNYKLTGVYSDHSLQGRAAVLERYRVIGASEETRTLLDFFVFGQPVDSDKLFKTDPALLAQMRKARLVEESQGAPPLKVRLNDLSLASYELANRKKIYLLSDLPSIHGARREPSAMISQTSHTLLAGLEDRLDPHIQGTVADFGSGNGIQSIALLTLYPKIKRAYGVEIDPQSIHLSVLNATLNEVGDRFEAIDNKDPGLLKKKLAGRKLDFAVSNPPFNIVPKRFEKRFPRFGFGGTDGLDVTKIFLGQIDANLKEGGQALLYTGLAVDRRGDPLLKKAVQSRWNNSVRYQRLEGGIGAEAWPNTDLEGYSSDLARTICYYYPKDRECKEEQGRARLARSIARDLSSAGISSVEADFLLVKKGGPKEFVEDRIVGQMPSTASLANPPEGGMYLRMEPVSRRIDPRNPCKGINFFDLEKRWAEISRSLSLAQMEASGPIQRVDQARIESVECPGEGKGSGVIRLAEPGRILTYENQKQCEELRSEVASLGPWGRGSFLVTEGGKVLHAAYHCGSVQPDNESGRAADERLTDAEQKPGSASTPAKPASPVPPAQSANHP